MLEDVFSNWAAGLALVTNPTILLYIMIGTILGLFFGAVPGLTAVLAMVLLLPLTYGMSPAGGIALLIGAYVGGITGGLISAVMIGIPGTAASIVTTFDGHPMAKRGEAGRAIGIGVVASFYGGLISWFALVFLTGLLAKVALAFGPFEYAAMIFFGFTIVSSLASKQISKGLLMTTLGMVLASIGTDPLHGVQRLTFGITALESGFGLVPLLSGIYVVSRALEEVETINIRYIVPPGGIKEVLPQLWKVGKSWLNILRSSFIGVAIGILPGIGAALAAFLSYDQAKKHSSHPETFGKGEREGIIASESTNNATIGSALVPGLALGIPGDVPVVVLLGGLMLHGLRPGPLFFRENLDIIYSIFCSYFFANLMMLLFMISIGARLFARIMVVPKIYLVPLILIAGLVGSYNVAYSMTDVWVSLIAGTIAYLAIKADYPLTPMVIAIILGPMVEYNLRVALTMSHGSFYPFIQKPIALGFLILAVLSMIIFYWSKKGASERLPFKGT